MKWLFALLIAFDVWVPPLKSAIKFNSQSIDTAFTSYYNIITINLD